MLTKRGHDAPENRQEAEREKRGEEKTKFTPPTNQTAPCRRSPNQPPSKPAMNGTKPAARRFTTVKLSEIRSAISTATAAEMPGSRIVRPADLSPTMKPPMAKARKLSTAASTICPPLSSTSLGLATLSSCGARESPRIRPAIKLSTTITTTPMPIHFQSKVPVISSSLLVTLVDAVTFSAAATAPDLTHTRTQRWSRPQCRGPGSSLAAGMSPAYHVRV